MMETEEVKKELPELSASQVRHEVADRLRPLFKQDKQSWRQENSGEKEYDGTKIKVTENGDVYYPEYGNRTLEQCHIRQLTITPESYSKEEHQTSRLIQEAFRNGATRVVTSYAREGNDNRDIVVMEIDPVSREGKLRIINTKENGRNHTYSEISQMMEERFSMLHTIKPNDTMTVLSDAVVTNEQTERVFHSVERIHQEHERALFANRTHVPESGDNNIKPTESIGEYSLRVVRDGSVNIAVEIKDTIHQVKKYSDDRKTEDVSHERRLSFFTRLLGPIDYEKKAEGKTGDRIVFAGKPMLKEQPVVRLTRKEKKARKNLRREQQRNTPVIFEVKSNIDKHIKNEKSIQKKQSEHKKFLAGTNEKKRSKISKSVKEVQRSTLKIEKNRDVLKKRILKEMKRLKNKQDVKNPEMLINKSGIKERIFHVKKDTQEKTPRLKRIRKLKEKLRALTGFLAALDRKEKKQEKNLLKRHQKQVFSEVSRIVANETQQVAEKSGAEKRGAHRVSKEQKMQKRQEKRAVVLWSVGMLVFALLKETRPKPSIQIHQIEDNKETQRLHIQESQQEQTPWLLLSIIWYLAQIREQGFVTVTQQPKKKTDKYKPTAPLKRQQHIQISQNPVLNGIIFTYGS
jgi:hypothetical protein